MNNFQVRDLRNGDWYYVHKTVYEEYGQKIGAIGIALYNALCYYSNRQTGKCYPSIKTLSQKLNISSVCVYFYLKKLKKYKLIKVMSGKQKGGSNIYFLLKVRGIKQVNTHVKHVNRGIKQVNINKNNITIIKNNKKEKRFNYTSEIKKLMQSTLDKLS